MRCVSRFVYYFTLSTTDRMVLQHELCSSYCQKAGNVWKCFKKGVFACSAIFSHPTPPHPHGSSLWEVSGGFSASCTGQKEEEERAADTEGTLLIAVPNTSPLTSPKISLAGGPENLPSAHPNSECKLEEGVSWWPGGSHPSGKT